MANGSQQYSKNSRHKYNNNGKLSFIILIHFKSGYRSSIWHVVYSVETDGLSENTRRRKRNLSLSKYKEKVPHSGENKMTTRSVNIFLLFSREKTPLSHSLYAAGKKRRRHSKPRENKDKQTTAVTASLSLPVSFENYYSIAHSALGVGKRNERYRNESFITDLLCFNFFLPLKIFRREK